MLKVDIVSSIEDVYKFIDGNYVITVIDVLRASSTITTALFNGALKVYVFREIEDAINFYKFNSNCILAGERGGLKISGFDLGNSPLEFSVERVYGKYISFTSSNCAKVVEAARNAKHMILSCFLNLSPSANYLKHLHFKYGFNIALICAGRYGYPSSEDIFCAEILRDMILGILDKPPSNNFSNFLRYTSAGRNLIKIGFTADVEYCGSVDLLNIIPVWDGNGFIGIKYDFTQPQP